jgi:hypothetical protein
MSSRRLSSADDVSAGCADAVSAPPAGAGWADAALAKTIVAKAVPEKRAVFSDMDARIESIPLGSGQAPLRNNNVTAHHSFCWPIHNLSPSCRRMARLCDTAATVNAAAARGRR